MPRRPDVPCADCGNLMWRSTTSLPPGKARCLPCRRARPVRAKPKPNRGRRKRACLDCGAPCWTLGARCRKCRDIAQRIRAADDPYVLRHHREHGAAGLADRQRRALRSRWIKQAKTCTYCDRPADTVDHVVPLVRGGTNYEGNLAPCCKTCNSSKGGRLVIEWKTGRRLAPMFDALVWPRQRKTTWSKPSLFAGVQLEFNLCPVCMTMHDRPIYCSQRCCSRAQYQRKIQRSQRPWRPPKTACPAGHPYTDENRRVRITVRDGVERIQTQCRPCRIEYKRRARMRKKV